ncbi:MAG: CPCC family cysteine-rich protein [Burkholderiaceae bacterium]
MRLENDRYSEMNNSVRCPCCGYKTLRSRGHYEICEVCFWEDDGQDDINADDVLGGPNGDLSLTQGRKNYQEFGAFRRQDLPYVRKPRLDEM